MINPIFKKLPWKDLDRISGYRYNHQNLLKMNHQQRVEYFLEKIEKSKDWIIEKYKQDTYELLILAAQKCWITQGCQIVISPDFEKDNRIELNDNNGDEIVYVVITVVFYSVIQIEFTTADNKRGKMTKLQPVIDYLKTLQPFTYTDRGEAITRSGNVTYL